MTNGLFRLEGAPSNSRWLLLLISVLLLGFFVVVAFVCLFLKMGFSNVAQVYLELLGSFFSSDEIAFGELVLSAGRGPSVLFGFFTLSSNFPVYFTEAPKGRHSSTPLKQRYFNSSPLMDVPWFQASDRLPLAPLSRSGVKYEMLCQGFLRRKSECGWEV